MWESVDFIKLDMTVRNILPQVVLTVPELSDTDQGHPFQFVIGTENTRYQEGIYYGQSMYKSWENELQSFDYLVYSSEAVQTERYIFVPVGYGYGGTGLFSYLTAIDKRNLIGLNSVYIGDRVKIVNVKVIDSCTDTVVINYIEQEAGSRSYQ